jgi:hypothetical protein
VSTSSHLSPHLATSTDHSMQQVQALRHVAPQYPDLPDRVPPASGGLHLSLYVPLPPADPQCHPPGRKAPGPGAGRPRSTARCFAFPRAPLDDQLHGLQASASSRCAYISPTSSSLPNGRTGTIYHSSLLGQLIFITASPARRPRRLLPLVLPVVLYNGEKPWTAPLSLAELFKPMEG